MKTKYFIMLICLITFFVTLSGGGNVAHFAHIGGIVFGVLYMKLGQWRTLTTRYKKIKNQAEKDRLKARFRVITNETTNREIDDFWKKHSDDTDRWN